MKSTSGESLRAARRRIQDSLLEGLSSFYAEITTHDLALTSIADELAPSAANVHFEDWFDGSEIGFDYRMKPRPVTRSSALALMRAVGLDVPSVT